MYQYVLYLFTFSPGISTFAPNQNQNVNKISLNYGKIYDVAEISTSLRVIYVLSDVLISLVQLDHVGYLKNTAK